jgi:hypothetical protein
MRASDGYVSKFMIADQDGRDWLRCRLGMAGDGLSAKTDGSGYGVRQTRNRGSGPASRDRQREGLLIGSTAA